MIKRPTANRPAPMVSTKSPSARVNFLSNINASIPKLSYTMDSTGASVDESRETAISEDFASPIVIHRDVSQCDEEKEKSKAPEKEKDDCEPTKEDGSTIAKYVERFRSTQPRSRVDRARSGLQAQPTDFWWTDGSDKQRSRLKSEIGVAYKSPIAKKKKQEVEKQKSMIPRMIRKPPEELHDYVDDEENSEFPAVSTDGLESNLSSNDTGVLRPLHLSDLNTPQDGDEEEEEDLTFRPEFIASPLRHPAASPPVRLQDDGDDILSRWRLRNQMELARERSRMTESPGRHHFKRTTNSPFASTPQSRSQHAPVIVPQTVGPRAHPQHAPVIDPQIAFRPDPMHSTFVETPQQCLTPSQPILLQSKTPHTAFQPVNPQQFIVVPQFTAAPQQTQIPAQSALLLNAQHPQQIPQSPVPSSTSSVGSRSQRRQPSTKCIKQDAETQSSPPPQHVEVQTSCHCEKKRRKKKSAKRNKGETVVSQVIARGLGLDEELQTSVNSIFGPDVSSERDLVSTVRDRDTTAITESVSALDVKSSNEPQFASTGRGADISAFTDRDMTAVSESFSAMDIKLSSDLEMSDREGKGRKSQTWEESVAEQDERAEKHMDDAIVRLLRYQLHSKLEQISLIDEELRSRAGHI